MKECNLESILPQDVVIRIATYWLKKNRYASVTLRKATARLLSKQYDYLSLESMYIQKLSIKSYRTLLDNVPKPRIIETQSSASCCVQLFVKNSVYPIYLLKHESTLHANIWFIHWLERHNGVRRYGRHSQTTTYFLNSENQWIE